MNQYTLDGVPLRDPGLRWYPDRDTGIRIVPARRQADQRYPHVDGQVWIPGAPFDPGAIAISLRVKGKTYLELKQNIEFIVGVFTQRHRMLSLVDHYSGESADNRVAQVTLASSVEPRMIDRDTALVSAVFTIPGTFWRSPSDIIGTTPAATNARVIHELTPLRGGNAPINDFLLRIRGGAFSTLAIEDPSSGRTLNIETPLLDTETMVIDTVDWKAMIHTGVTDDTWALTGGRDVSGTVAPNQGWGTMLIAEPTTKLSDMSMMYRFALKGTNVTGSPAVTYRAKRSYL